MEEKDIWMYGMVCSQCKRASVIFIEDVRFGEFYRKGFAVSEYYAMCGFCGNSNNILSSKEITPEVASYIHGTVQENRTLLTKFKSLFQK